MTRFDRFLISRFLGATVLLTALLVVIFIVLDFVEHIDDFMDRGASMRAVVVDYYLHYIPEMIRLVSPLAVFLAAIYTTARLSQTLQLIALTMAGVSLYRIMLPFVASGILLTTALFLFNGYVVPRTNASVLEFQLQYYKEAPGRVEYGEVFRQTAPGSLLSVGFYDVTVDRGFRISLQQFEGEDERSITSRIDAPEMVWVDSLNAWRLRDATRRDFTEDGREIYQKIPQLDTTLAVLPRDLARTERDAARLTIPEAAEYIESLRRAGASNLGQPLVDYYSKFSYPLASLILIVIGVPLASVRRRGGQAVQFGIGLGVALVYLTVQRVVEPFGYVDTISPVAAAWLPHAAFGVIAVVVLLRTKK